MFDMEPPIEKHTLPILMWLWNGLHGEKLKSAIFKKKSRNASGGCQTSEPSQTFRLAMNPRRIAKPIDRDAQLRKCLLQNPGSAVFSLDQNGSVRNSAGQDSDGWMLAGADALCVAQVHCESYRVLDVQLGTHFTKSGSNPEPLP